MQGHGQGHGGGAGKRMRIVKEYGACGCGGHGHEGHGRIGHGRGGYGFRRQFESREEKAAKLEGYLADLKAEVIAVEEKLADLRG